MRNDIDTLRPEVRAAMRTMNGEAGGNRDDAYEVIEAELLRLSRENVSLRNQARGDQALIDGLESRAEHAEAELAALKARILPGAAKVEIADTDGPDGDPYGWVGGTLLSHDLIGKRVRLVVEE